MNAREQFACSIYYTCIRIRRQSTFPSSKCDAASHKISLRNLCACPLYSSHGNGLAGNSFLQLMISCDHKNEGDITMLESPQIRPDILSTQCSWSECCS